MTLYKGNAKIQDTGSYGIFIGNRPIDRIYKGSEKVYQYHPYTPEQVLFFETGQAQETITLPFGVYSLAVTGGGGDGKFEGYISGALWSSSGGSGATWEGTFYVPTTAELVLYAGGAVEASYINVGGNRFITAGNGGTGQGAGGAITVNTVSDVQVVTTDISANGTAGYLAPGATNSRLSASTYGWGASAGYNTSIPSGHVQQGGFRLQFLRRDL